jgi:CubicO group peptidase (beta-lactamase class C family)
MTQKVAQSWQGVTPGFQIQMFLKGQKKIDLSFGETYPYYDWASLTKIVFSASQLMMAYDEKRFRLEDPIQKWVPWFRSGAPASSQRLKDLMTHSAGLDWWRPLYKQLEIPLTRSAKSQRLLWPQKNWQQLRPLLKKKMSRPSVLVPEDSYKKQSVYSDLDLFILGYAMENFCKLSLQELAVQTMDRLGLKETSFHFANQPLHARKLYAPTESEAFYGATRAGEVNDENTWALGGVAPHAGLFGPISDLSRWGLSLRSTYFGKKQKHFASPETVRLFTKRAVPRKVGDWALLFMMPSKGKASCGRLFSPQSVGHTGFTGTSLWFDPKSDCLVTILSNRVHPSRENEAFKTYRPQLHNWALESVGL